MDGDGDLDVLSASSGDDKIAWYENDGALNGTPTFVQGGPPVILDADVDVSDAELEILKVLWEQGPATVRDVVAALPRRQREKVGVEAAVVVGLGATHQGMGHFMDQNIAEREIC